MTLDTSTNPQGGDTGDDRYKSIQRELEKQRVRNRELTKDSIETAALRVQSLETANFVKQLVNTITEGGDTDEIINQFDEKAAVSTKEVSFKKGIADMVDFDDLQNDEVYGDARKAWDSGDYEKAHGEVEKIVGPAQGTASAEAIQAEVQKVLRAAGYNVDSGSSSVGGDNQPFDMENFKAMSPADRLANIDKLKAALNG